MASKQFYLDMAAALSLSTQAKRDAALKGVYLAEAARTDDVVPDPDEPPPPPPPPPDPPDPPPVVVPPVTRADQLPRPFAASSPFNTPTPAGTQWFDHPRLHSLPSGGFLHWFVLRPFAVTYAHASDPLWTFKMSDHVASDFHRNRPAQTFTAKAPDWLERSPDSDQTLHVVQDNGDYVEIWMANVDKATRTVTGRGWATGNMITGPGAGTLENNDGVRAANFSWAAGLITGQDLATGVIDHALAVALTQSTLADTIGNYQAPATAWDNGSGSSGPIRMGTKIGVPAGVPAPSGLTATGSMLFKALQKYGAYVGDYVGGDWPAFYADRYTVTQEQIDPLYAWWAFNADLDKIGPLLRVEGYAP